MLLVQASKDIPEPGQVYKIGILVKIVDGLKFILRIIWCKGLFVTLESVIRVIQLIVPFNHLDDDPLFPG